MAARPTRPRLRKPPPLLPAPLRERGGAIPAAPAHPEPAPIPTAALWGGGRRPRRPTSALWGGCNCLSCQAGASQPAAPPPLRHGERGQPPRTSAVAAIFGEPHNGRDAILEPGAHPNQPERRENQPKRQIPLRRHTPEPGTYVARCTKPAPQPHPPSSASHTKARD